jgi:hypothetical protein
MGQVKFRRKKFQNFQNFRKIKKRCDPSEMRTKPKLFGKFGKKFQNFLFLCAFWTICHFFDFSKFFEKIEISQRKFSKIFEILKKLKTAANGVKREEN